jgi:hypothetical protein
MRAKLRLSLTFLGVFDGFAYVRNTAMDSIAIPNEERDGMAGKALTKDQALARAEVTRQKREERSRNAKLVPLALAARELGLSAFSLGVYCREERIKSVLVGRLRFIPRPEVERIAVEGIA